MTIAPMSRYDATTALKKIACGTFTATDYLKACLDRIAEREEDVGAFTHLAAQRALVQASDVDARPFSGTLHGMPDQRHYRYARHADRAWLAHLQGRFRFLMPLA